MDEAKKSHRMKQWVRDLIYGVVIVLFSIGNIRRLPLCPK